MAINKPTKPDSELPETWGGTQYPYTEEEVENGYLETVPQIVDGGKLNYQMKGIFERLKYTTTIADIVNNTPIGQVVAVDQNNRFEYQNLPVISSDDEYSEGVSTVLSPSVKQVADSFSEVVSKTGDTMTGSLTVEKTDGIGVPFRVKRSDITFGTKPSETKEGEVIRLVDSTNNLLLGALKYKYNTDGSFSFYLLGRSPLDSSKYTANVGIAYLADGTPFVMGVQPPTSSNSTSSMTTTAWTRTVCVGNPNYNAAVSRTVGTEYTAATNGWLRVDSVQKDNTTCKLIIDGAHTPYQVFCGEYFDGNIAVIIPVVKGQKYKGENLVSMWWYPSI